MSRFLAVLVYQLYGVLILFLAGLSGAGGVSVFSISYNILFFFDAHSTQYSIHYNILILTIFLYLMRYDIRRRGAAAAAQREEVFVKGGKKGLKIPDRERDKDRDSDNMDSENSNNEDDNEWVNLDNKITIQKY